MRIKNSNLARFCCFVHGTYLRVIIPGGYLRNFWVGCTAGTLEPLAYTTAGSAEFFTQTKLNSPKSPVFLISLVWTKIFH